MADEQELEFTGEETEGETSEMALKRLRTKLKECQAERQEYLETSQRLRADYVNLKRQSESERGQIIKFANESLLLELVELMNSLDQAAAWFPGTEQIAAKFVGILKQNGIEIINPLHREFDPAEAEALANLDKIGRASCRERVYVLV